MKKKLPDLGYLRECFSLGRDGSLYWKQRPANHFDSLRIMRGWNTKYAGKRAGYLDKKVRYWEVNVNKITYLQHRIVFLMYYGYLPANQIDHIDRNPYNNQPNNLREANSRQNGANSKIYSTNTSGIKGVCWSKEFNKWKATININNQIKNLGLFNSKAQATNARQEAAKRYFGVYNNG